MSSPSNINPFWSIGRFGSANPGGRNILLVQTDWEMGMSRLARDLKERGHNVSKVVLNFSDWFYRLRGIESFGFSGPIDDFREWLESVVSENRIDTLFVYNTTRPYNQIACQLAAQRGLSVVHFEQGLLRPLHVSVFLGTKPPFQDIRSLWSQKEERSHWPAAQVPPADAGVSTARKNLLFGLSVLVALTFKHRFPHYRDQRTMSLRYHFFALLANAYRFQARAGQGRRYLPKIHGEWNGKYFLIPLQLSHDAQIVHYSGFDSMDEMLDRVADSFLEHGDPEDRLLIKVHPLDRGYRTFEGKIAELKERLGEDRVQFIDRVPLDELLSHSKGVVTINSTVGLTALRHLKAVKVLGEAFYDLEDLTFQGSLDEFWSEAEPPNQAPVKQFINLLEMTIQGRGTLSRRCFRFAGHSGILWPANFARSFDLPSLGSALPANELIKKSG